MATHRKSEKRIGCRHHLRHSQFSAGDEFGPLAGNCVVVIDFGIGHSIISSFPSVRFVGREVSKIAMVNSDPIIHSAASHFSTILVSRLSSHSTAHVGLSNGGDLSA